LKNTIAKNPIELEAKLIVCSKRPKQIFSEITEFNKIENYHLVPQKTIQLQDVYWDEPNNSLQKNQISLRTRSKDSKRLITIKGAAEITSWGAVKRKEIEVLWTREGYNQIIKELVQNGINVPDISENFDADSPKTTFLNLGFIIIQDRRTKRQVINILSENEKSILAELVLDSVQYEIKGKNINHFELEIESKHNSGEEALQSILGFILNQFQSEVKNWTHSKLAIGKALEQLLSDQTWNKFVDGSNNILPSTYDRISEILISNKM
jgi:inorganic triphosphatase YgiF